MKPIPSMYDLLRYPLLIRNRIHGYFRETVPPLSLEFSNIPAVFFISQIPKLIEITADLDESSHIFECNCIQRDEDLIASH